jgi:hypothetical protein
MSRLSRMSDPIEVGGGGGGGGLGALIALADLGAVVLLALDLEEPPPFFDQASSLASCSANTAEQIKMGFRKVMLNPTFG